MYGFQVKPNSNRDAHKHRFRNPIFPEIRLWYLRALGPLHIIDKRIIIYCAVVFPCWRDSHQKLVRLIYSFVYCRNREIVHAL